VRPTLTSSSLGLSKKCLSVMNEANELLKGVNIYDVFAPCEGGSAIENKCKNVGGGTASWNSALGMGSSKSTRTSGLGFVTPNSVTDGWRDLQRRIFQEENEERARQVKEGMGVRVGGREGRKERDEEEIMRVLQQESLNTPAGCYVGTSRDGRTKVTPYNVTLKALKPTLPGWNPYETAGFNMLEVKCVSFCDASTGTAYYSFLSIHLIRPLKAGGRQPELNTCESNFCNKPITCQAATHSTVVPVPVSSHGKGISCLIGSANHGIANPNDDVTTQVNTVSIILPHTAPAGAFECIIFCSAVVSQHYSELYAPMPQPLAALLQQEYSDKLVRHCSSSHGCNSIASYGGSACPLMPTPPPSSSPPSSLMAINETLKVERRGRFEYLDDDYGPSWLSGAGEGAGDVGMNSCPGGAGGEGGADVWMMNPAVHKALHITKSIDYCWMFCITAANWNYLGNMGDETKEVYPFILGRIDVLIMNGDVDACVPYTDNLGWIASMNLPVRRPWHPWFYRDYSLEDDSDQSFAQLGGYMQEYDVEPLKGPAFSQFGNKQPGSFHFATIRGAGHQAAFFRPEPVFDLISRFLQLKGAAFAADAKPPVSSLTPTSPLLPLPSRSPSQSPIQSHDISQQEQHILANEALKTQPAFIAVTTLLACALGVVVVLGWRLILAERAVVALESKLNTTRGALEMTSAPAYGMAADFNRNL